MQNWTTNSLFIYEFCTSYETEFVLSVVQMKKQQQFHIATCTKHVNRQKIMVKFWLKVNSVQEACANCFALQILKFEILQTT